MAEQRLLAERPLGIKRKIESLLAVINGFLCGNSEQYQMDVKHRLVTLLEVDDHHDIDESSSNKEHPCGDSSISSRTLLSTLASGVTD